MHWNYGRLDNSCMGSSDKRWWEASQGLYSRKARARFKAMDKVRHSDPLNRTSIRLRFFVNNYSGIAIIILYLCVCNKSILILKYMLCNLCHIFLMDAVFSGEDL